MDVISSCQFENQRLFSVPHWHGTSTGCLLTDWFTIHEEEHEMFELRRIVTSLRLILQSRKFNRQKQIDYWWLAGVFAQTLHQSSFFSRTLSLSPWRPRAFSLFLFINSLLVRSCSSLVGIDKKWRMHFFRIKIKPRRQRQSSLADGQASPSATTDRRAQAPETTTRQPRLKTSIWQQLPFVKKVSRQGWRQRSRSTRWEKSPSVVFWCTRSDPLHLSGDQEEYSCSSAVLFVDGRSFSKTGLLHRLCELLYAKESEDSATDQEEACYW